MSDWSSEAVDVLREVIDRIIPRDEDPSATDLEVDRYILRQMLAGAVPDHDLIRAGLQALSTAIGEKCGRDAKSTLAGRELDAMLRVVATAPWFQALVELAAEGYYADPGNGGNAGARSWTMIGYEHRLPEGPDGPPLAEYPNLAIGSMTGNAPDDRDGPRPVETAGHRIGG